MHIRRIHSIYRNNRIDAPFFTFLFAVGFSNLLGLGSYMLLVLCGIYFTWNYCRVKIPASVFPILLFSCLYFVFQIGYGDTLGTFKIFLCPLLWLVGYNFDRFSDVRAILKTAAILALGMAVHGLANYYYNTVAGISMGEMTKMDIWTGEGTAATGQAVLFTPFLALFTWLVFAEQKRWIKAGVLLLFFCALMYSIQLGSRTFLLLAILSVLPGVLFSAQKRGIGLKILLAAAVLAAIVAVLYSKDTFGLRTYIEGSYLFRRMAVEKGFYHLSENSRFHYKKKYLENAFRYPWGGSHLHRDVVGAYAHDLWLDILDEAGILTALAILIYTTIAFCRILLLSQSKKSARDESVALRSYAMIMGAQFFVEPIWQGSPQLLLYFVMIDGMLSSCVMQCRKRASQ